MAPRRLRVNNEFSPGGATERKSRAPELLTSNPLLPARVGAALPTLEGPNYWAVRPAVMYVAIPRGPPPQIYALLKRPYINQSRGMKGSRRR